MPARSLPLVPDVPPYRARSGACEAMARQIVFCLSALIRAWLVAASELDYAGKLLAVNHFFNQRMRLRDDIEVWGQTDYWASPPELLPAQGAT